MPAGQAMSRFGSGIFSFFFFYFVVVTNQHINLCIKIRPPLVEMYCSDCLEQKRPNQNLLSARTSRGRGPTYLYLCDIKANHLLEKFFIQWRPHVCRIQKESKPFSSSKSK